MNNYIKILFIILSLGITKPCFSQSIVGELSGFSFCSKKFSSLNTGQLPQFILYNFVSPNKSYKVYENGMYILTTNSSSSGSIVTSLHNCKYIEFIPVGQVYPRQASNKPDVIVTDIYFCPGKRIIESSTNGCSVDTVTINFIVANITQIPIAIPLNTRIYFDNTMLYEITIPPLNVNQYIDTSLVIPRISGDHVLDILVDYDNRLSEFSETNNNSSIVSEYMIPNNINIKCSNDTTTVNPVGFSGAIWTKQNLPLRPSSAFKYPNMILDSIPTIKINRDLTWYFSNIPTQ